MQATGFISDSRTHMDRFAVIIPVYNHAETVVEVIRSVQTYSFPVIVVDDGSTDDTAIKLRAVKGIRVLTHSINIGKGAALITGMRAADGIADWAICLDADGQHDPKDIIALIAAIPKEKRPIVIGNRRGMETAPWTSRFGRQFSNFWVWVSGAPFLADSQSGFRIYPLPETLKLDVKSRRYQYEIEVLVKASWNNMPMAVAPIKVSYLPPGQRVSHFHPFFDFLRNTQTFSRLITRRVFTPSLWRSRMVV